MLIDMDSERSVIRFSKVSPAFLSANSTSHDWPFSAFAELIDNAYDPDVCASELSIEIRTIQNEKCFVFTDNGAGMTLETLYKMLSFGFSDKPQGVGHQPIGQYGNGFKSGSMRLGDDAIVFTCHKEEASVGFLSQTYLRAIGAETVLVPIVSWSLPDFKPKLQSSHEQRTNLEQITKFSIFKSSISLLAELKELYQSSVTGTKIIIYNLKKNSQDNFELDTVSSNDDILNPETAELDRNNMIRMMSETKPTYYKSLKEYCNILYLKPRMKIYLRGKKVPTQLTGKSLKETEYESYKPSWILKFQRRPVKIILGISSSSNEEDYGAMLYYKNRLIRGYEKMGYQKQHNGLGMGVVAVVETNFLTPIHNKQDFLKDEKYNAFVSQLAYKMNLYYNVKTDQVNAQPEVPIKTPWNWVQCDKCLKWRRLQDCIDNTSLPDKWFCYMNRDAAYNRCDIAEEPEDEDDVMLNRASYSKKYKEQQENLKKRLAEEEERKKMEKEQELLRRERDIVKKEKQTVGSIDIVKAKRALELARRRDQQQSDLINQLQQEKDELQRQKVNVLKIAEQLALQNLDPSNIQNSQIKARNKKRKSDTTVSSSDVSSKNARVSDTVIKTEPTSEEEDTFWGSGPVIDLTEDDENHTVGSSNPDVSPLRDGIQMSKSSKTAKNSKNPIGRCDAVVANNTDVSPSSSVSLFHNDSLSAKPSKSSRKHSKTAKETPEQEDDSSRHGNVHNKLIVKVVGKKSICPASDVLDNENIVTISETDIKHECSFDENEQMGNKQDSHEGINSTPFNPDNNLTSTNSVMYETSNDCLSVRTSEPCNISSERSTRDSYAQTEGKFMGDKCGRCTGIASTLDENKIEDAPSALLDLQSDVLTLLRMLHKAPKIKMEDLSEVGSYVKSLIKDLGDNETGNTSRKQC